MKKTIKKIIVTSAVILGISGIVYAQPITFPYNGGTGAGTWPVNSILTTGTQASGVFQATSTQPLYVGSIYGTTTSSSVLLGKLSIGSTNPSAILDVAAPTGAGSTNVLRLLRIGGYGETDFAQYYNSVVDYGLNVNSGQLLLNVANGNFGVSTSSPGSVFSVGCSGLSCNGINFSTVGTSTFSTLGGINLTAGCFSVNGVCVGSGGGTVTSVSTNNGLTGGTITTTGTLGLDISKEVSNTLQIWNGTQLQATGTPSLTVGYLIATSTATSTFIGPVSQPNIAVRNAATGCATFGAGGYLLSTGSACGSGGGSSTTFIATSSRTSQLGSFTNFINVSATTTSVTSGQRIAFWARCTFNQNQNQMYLDVNIGGATTTVISIYGNTNAGAVDALISGFGIYDVTNTGTLNMEITQDNGSGTHQTANCMDPALMYTR